MVIMADMRKEFNLSEKRIFGRKISYSELIHNSWVKGLDVKEFIKEIKKAYGEFNDEFFERLDNLAGEKLNGKN